MKIVAISDTHGQHRALQLPAGDLLVHAGDLSVAGEQEQIEDFVEWFGSTDFEHKVFVAGNHDRWAELNGKQLNDLARAHKVNYLNGNRLDIAGIKIWGSPITPSFMNWSFMLDRGPQIAAHWAGIPQDTDILITHGPPFGILDEVQSVQTTGSSSVERTGCRELAKRLSEVSPDLHIFGHIHECYGQLQSSTTRYINACSMGRDYVVKNDPVVLDFRLQVDPGSVDMPGSSDVRVPEPKEVEG